MASDGLITDDANGTALEAFALQIRAEQMALLSRAKAAREGESDRLEIGNGGGSDTVVGTESLRVGGNLTEHGHDRITQAQRLETTVDGKMSLRAFSDTTLMAGAMTDVQTGAMLVLAGMSDDLVVGGGMRLTLMDLWACGLMGMEENPLSVFADAAFLEGYRTHFEREYGAGIHLVGAATFTGSLHTTMATGFRALMGVAMGVRNLAPAGGSAPAGSQAGAPAATAPPAVDPPSPSGSNPQVLTAADDAENLGDVAHVDAAADAADIDVQSLDEVNDSATVLEDLRQGGSSPPPDYPAPPPPDVRPPDHEYDVPNSFSTGVTPGWVDGSGEFDDLVPPVPARDYESPVFFDPAAPPIYPAPESPNEYDELGKFIRGTGLPDDVHLYDDLVPPPLVVNGDDSARFGEGVIPGWVVGPNPDDDIVPPIPARGYETPVPVQLPEDFDYLEELEKFRQTLQADYRDDTVPGLTIMQIAHTESGQLPWQQLRQMDPQWLADAGINADELARLKDHPADAYQKIVDMEAAARAAGNVQKADALRDSLRQIDSRAFVLWQNALKDAEELRPTGFLPLPSNINVDSVLADLQAGLADVQRRSEEAMDAGDLDRVRELSLEGSFYSNMMVAIRKGYDPTPYLMELSRVTILGMGDDVDAIALVHRWREDVFAILGDSKHLFNKDLPNGFFFDPGDVVNTPVDVGDNWRKLRGIPDNFDFATYRSYLANLNLDNATDAQVDEIRQALDAIDEAPLTQLDNLPSTYIYETGMAAELAAARESQDPVAAYRILQQMEAFYRQGGDAATAEDLAKADHLRSIIDNIDATVIDEYTKIYDLLRQVSEGNVANTPVPFILDRRVLPPSETDDADEVQNLGRTDSPETIYSLLSDEHMGVDDAATFDDVQAGLDIRPQQVDIERAGVEDATYVNVAGADNEYDDIVVTQRRGEIEEATGDTYLTNNVEGNDFEGVDEEAIYGDFTFRDHRMVYGNRTVESDNWKLMTEEEWLEAARGKYKRATPDDWVASTRTQVTFVVDVEEDPLKFIDDGPPAAPPLDNPNDGPPGHVWDQDLNRWVPSPGGDDPPVRNFVDDGTYATLGESIVPFGTIRDPETGALVVPPEDSTFRGPFSGYNLDLVNPASDTTTQGDDIYEITRRRIEIAEEGTYNTLVFGFQTQAPDSIYSRLDELKMSTDFTDAPRDVYVNVDYSTGRAILVDSLDGATDVVTPPVVPPEGLNRPAVIRVQFEGDVLITVVDFADEALEALPPVTLGPNESVYELLSPVLTSQIDDAVGPVIRRPDGTVAVIEDIWESTDPLTTVLNRELHRVVPETLAAADPGPRLSRLHETVNSYVNAKQATGAVFNLADLNDLDEIVMFNEVPWQVAADPLLNPQLHQMSDRGDDFLSLAFNRGGFGLRPRSVHW